MKEEITFYSVEELKEYLRSLPEDVMLHITVMGEEADADGEEN